ncbi:MAG: radical SAM protein [Desulfuromonadaceae bacterium]|nr:radical SAM protein [Desulfuromonadaceae bacterium]
MDPQLEKKRRDRLAQEIGREAKAWGGRLSVALLFPNRYAHAMSNLGFQGVYGWLQQHDDCLCERFFLPERDELNLHQQKRLPLLSLESGRPVGDFDVLAISLSFENDYLNLPQLFELMRLPLYVDQRTAHDPLVVGGGICVLMNPEPVADFFDLFAVGEAEVLMPALVEELLSSRQRPALLQNLSRHPGFYVPSAYDAEYDAQGRFVRLTARDGACLPVRRQWLADLDTSACRTLIHSPEASFGRMRLVEVSRGCGRGCRFCATGFVYLPPREKAARTVLQQLNLQQMEGETAGLVGAAVSDYSHIAEVADAVCAAGGHISVASLRIDSLTREQVRQLRETGQKTLALAPEAGSQRLRDLINKNLTREQILDAVTLLAEEGILHLKLYFLIGLPTESDEDLTDLMTLVEEARELWLDAQRPLGRLGTLTLSVNPFIPKAMTPFQWEAMAYPKVLKKRVARLNQWVRRLANVSLQVESLRSAELQALLSRGDRRLAAVIERMAHGENAAAACREGGIALEDILYRQRSQQEPLPWDHLESGPGKEYLWKEYQRGLACQLTAPCHSGCRRCPVCRNENPTP